MTNDLSDKKEIKKFVYSIILYEKSFTQIQNFIVKSSESHFSILIEKTTINQRIKYQCWWYNAQIPLLLSEP